MAPTSPIQMVIKKDGTLEEFDKHKFMRRIFHAYGEDAEETRLPMASKLADIVTQAVPWPVKSSQLDEVLAETAAHLEIHDLVYGTIATNVQLDVIYKATPSSFSQAMSKIGNRVLSTHFLDLVNRNKRELDAMIDDAYDALLSYFALRVLERSYFLKDPDTGKILERPQYVFLRAALQMHADDIRNVEKSYDFISSFKFMPASPILFNSGRKSPQLSSCFLVSARAGPSELFSTLSDVAEIGRRGGGIGLGLTRVEGQGSVVEGVGRMGIPALLKMLDAALPVIDQSVQNRPAAMSVHLECWHPDIVSFVRSKRSSGPEANRTDRLFYAVLINDLFMKRVETDQEWTLFCPSVAGRRLGLAYGENFDDEYAEMEEEGLGVSKIRARALWKEIIVSLIETGGPSILFKDAINDKSNQSHLGCITQSNLCTEIVQYCDEHETAVCNLASVVLPNFVNVSGELDYQHLETVIRHVVLALNEVLCQSHTPTSRAERSMPEHCAIGIGLQGLADALVLMRIPFDSDKAVKVNALIAETIYFAAMDESCNRISTLGTYPSFLDSPASTGWLQHDNWDIKMLSDRYNWGRLRTKMKKGMTNSLLIAYMPTAGTSQLTGCSECFEPYTSLIQTRKVLSGEFVVFPKELVRQLQNLKLWDEDMMHSIIAMEGSIQHIDVIPKDIRELFKTAWEIHPSILIQQAAARGPFVCQSQSMSLFMKSPSLSDVSQALFQGWRSGLKTGIYYLRTKAAAKALPVTLPVRYWNAKGDEDEPICISCSA